MDSDLVDVVMNNHLGGSEDAKSTESKKKQKESESKKEKKRTRRGMKRIKDVHAYLKAKTPEEIFKEFDADNSGLIDQDEFLAMIEALQFKLPEAKALKFFQHCDKDGSGEINLEEFQSVLFACNPTSGNTFGFAPEEFLSPHDAFHHYDVDNSGTIDEDEFADILEYLKLEVDDFKQERLFRKYDIDGSGSIDYEEFKACWLDCVDIRAELRKRKIPFGKMTPTYVLKKKLAKIVDEEENKEEKVLASADQNLEYMRTKKDKENLFLKAKILADEALSLALDVAGQVYVFGRGTQGQFSGEAYLEHFEKFRNVHRLWYAFFFFKISHCLPPYLHLFCLQVRSCSS